MKAGLILVLATFAVVACKPSEEVQSSLKDRCPSGAAEVDEICSVAAVQLLLAPAAFDGKHISTVLYYPGHRSRVLFASRDAAEANDLVSGFVFDEPAAGASSAPVDPRNPGFYRVVARFELSAPIVVGEGVVPPLAVGGRFAKIQSLTRIAGISEIIAECERREGCVMQYSRGLLPLPRLPAASEN